MYIKYLNEENELSGIGVEVKYTEKGYRIGITEKENVENKKSNYWRVTRSSGLFIDDSNVALASDSMRQIWKNHLLGLSMIQRGEIKDFISITLYPLGNEHYQRAILQYQSLLKESYRHLVRGCSYEHYIEKITGDDEILHWKEYLAKRYLID